MTSTMIQRAAQVAAMAVLLFGAATAPASADVTSLLLQSDPGDYIGQGQIQYYTAADATFLAQEQFGAAVRVSMNTPNFEHWWYVSFAAPDGAPLTVGVYAGAVRFPFQETGQAGLDVSGDGRGCNQLTGSFEILQITYGAGDQIVALWATFEQHCEGATPALRGEVRFNADVPLTLTIPGDARWPHGQQITVPVTANDSLGGAVTLAAFELPEGATFTDHGDNTGTFIWTPELGHAGIHTIRFQGQNAQNVVETVYLDVIVTPANDDFQSAMAIAVANAGSLGGSITEATEEDGEPEQLSAPSVWFTFTPTASSRMILEVASTTFLPGVAVFVDSTPHTPAALQDLVEVTADGPGTFDPRSVRRVIDAVNGTTYYIAVSGWTIDDGSFTLEWRRAELTRVLWKHTTGAITVWTLDDAGAIVSHPTFGPYSGWTAVRIGVGADGHTRVLWRHVGGTATIWVVDVSGQVLDTPVFGPYPEWTPADMAIATNGAVHLLWTHPTGVVVMWEMTADANTVASNVVYGPYTGWVPMAIALDGELNRRLLWRSTTGAIALWREPWPYNAVSNFGQAGPFSGWTAVDMGAGTPDGGTRLLWRHANGSMGLWRKLLNGTLNTSSYGPFAGWEPVTIALPHVDPHYGDVYSRVLWRRTDGAISLWKTGPTGALVKSFAYGPFAGWSVVDIAVGPE